MFNRVCSALLLFLAVYGAFSARIVSNNAPLEGPDGSYCSLCVSLLGNTLEELYEIILNIGVVTSCGQVCSMLPNSLEGQVCSLLCDYVGIDAFVKVIEYEDPDPIYACEELGLCFMTGSGAANSVSFDVSPESGPAGSTFTLTYTYTVAPSTTQQPLSDAELIANGQAPGTYNLQFQLEAKPSEQDPFAPGLYLTQIAICAGDCSGKHTDSGVYCSGVGNFTITGSTGPSPSPSPSPSPPSSTTTTH